MQGQNNLCFANFEVVPSFMREARIKLQSVLHYSNIFGVNTRETDES